MAATPFIYQGQGYQIDENGTILAAGGSRIPPGLLADPAFQAAGAAAQNPSGTTLTATPPRATASQMAAGGAAEDQPPGRPLPPVTAPGVPQPAAAPAIPATPPRSGIGSDVTNRAQLKSVQDELDNMKPANDDGSYSNAQMTQRTALTARATAISASISKNEQPPTTNIVSGTAAPDQEFIVTEDPANPGQFLKQPNPAADPALVAAAKAKGGGVETHIVGNNMIRISPDGSVSSSVVNAQAQANDDLQARAQATSAAASAANAEANAFAAKSKATIDGMVARGEDAASVRADLQRQSEEIHARATEAIAAATAAQQALDSANVERHANVRDQQAAEAATQLAKDNAQRSTDTRYGYDTSAASSKYASDTSAKSAAYTAKLSAATNLYQNSLSALAEVNKALPPGSDLAGKALEGMLAYGTKFLNGFAGGGGTDPTQTSGIDPSKDVVPPPGAPVVDPYAGQPSPWQRADANQTAPDPTTGLAPPGAAGTVPVDAPNYLGMTAPTPSYMLGAGTGPVNSGVSAERPSASFMLGAGPGAVNTGSDLAAANQAAHQANMAAPTTALHPDGSPIAGPADVARVFGRVGGV